MVDNSMDKLYFMPPEGSAPKYIRGLISQLSNYALNVREDQKNTTKRQALLNALKELQEMEYFAEYDTPSTFVTKVSGDFFSACSYWEEEWRYDLAMPIIELAVLNKDFLKLEEIPGAIEKEVAEPFEEIPTPPDEQQEISHQPESSKSNLKTGIVLIGVILLFFIYVLIVRP